mmetsp:Transcript_17259/g.45379  ORF Transcript_17259/g.45379 Transcript_17259/m.45379 type:complete len:208 (+) Transcript_17259:542-1165(+)
MLGHLVEGRVQQLEDVHRLVRHELPGLLVEERRRRERAARVAGFRVDVADGGRAGRVRNQSVVAIIRAVAERVRERRVARGAVDPAAVRVLRVVRSSALPGGVHDRERDGVLEALEVEHGESAGGPRARERDVKVVAPRLGLDCVGAVLGRMAHVGTVLVRDRVRCSSNSAHGPDWRRRRFQCASGDCESVQEAARRQHAVTRRLRR